MFGRRLTPGNAICALESAYHSQVTSKELQCSTDGIRQRGKRQPVSFTGVNMALHDAAARFEGPLDRKRIGYRHHAVGVAVKDERWRQPPGSFQPWRCKAKKVDHGIDARCPGGKGKCQSRAKREPDHAYTTRGNADGALDLPTQGALDSLPPNRKLSLDFAIASSAIPGGFEVAGQEYGVAGCGNGLGRKLVATTICEAIRAVEQDNRRLRTSRRAISVDRNPGLRSRGIGSDRGTASARYKCAPMHLLSGLGPAFLGLGGRQNEFDRVAVYGDHEPDVQIVMRAA